MQKQGYEHEDIELMKNYLSSLDNENINIDSTLEQIKQYRFTAKDKILFKTKDFDLYETQNKELTKFYRKSNDKQSNYEFSTLKEIVGIEHTLFFANDSSSFFDEAFLQFLKYCIDTKRRTIEVLSFTRSAISTVTRSFETANKIIAYIQKNQNHFNKIMVDSLDLTDRMNNSLFLLFVSQHETDFLHKSVNKWSNKTKQYYDRLVNGNNKPFTKTKGRTTEELEKEYRALRNYNKDRFKTFLKFLKLKHDKKNSHKS